MNHIAVIGLGFGDEGKGTTTDYLCSFKKNPIVVRFSGGQQAGHTVLHKGTRHIFSNFGSGSLRGVPTFWSKYCTVDPVGIANEMDILKQKGITPVLYIDERCPITTPYEKIMNTRDLSDGTCGTGVGKTHTREENFYSLTFGDLQYPEIFNKKLKLIEKFYGCFPEDVSLDVFNECCQIVKFSKNIHPVFDCPMPVLEPYSDFIYEGSQGLMLDPHIGFFPHVTRSNVGSKNVMEMCLEQFNVGNPEYYLVTRAYQTRHGKGPMTNEFIDHKIVIDKYETNIQNQFQGDFRRTVLDVDLLEYAIKKDDNIREGKKTLVITCMDHIENEYKFTYRENLITCVNENEFVSRISVILNISSILLSYSADSFLYEWQK